MTNKINQPQPSSFDPDMIKRDSFTMPMSDYVLIDKIKKDLIEQGVVLNKAEILRAGLIALHEQTGTEKVETAKKVRKIKVGRKKS